MERAHSIIGAAIGFEVGEDGVTRIGVGGGQTRCGECGAVHDNPKRGWEPPYMMPCGHDWSRHLTASTKEGA